MAKKQQRPERSSVVKPVADRNNRDDALEERYGRRPSLPGTLRGRPDRLDGLPGSQAPTR